MTLFTINSFIYTILSNKDFKFEPLIFLTLTSYGLALWKDLPFKAGLLGLGMGLNILFVLKNIKLELIRDVNILPISTGMVKYFSLGFIGFTLILIYLLDPSVFFINISLNFMFLIIEVFLILFVKEREDTYEKTYKFYYLSSYLAEEREKFARLIHDDIIQDVFAARNFLSLKNPKVDLSKDILNDLEKKSRKIMAFYQSNLFENYGLEGSIGTIFENIRALYPEKEIRVSIDLGSEEGLEKRSKRLVGLITRELINNIYKHSKASYISYELGRENGKIIILIESDGIKEEDFKKMAESKRGLLFIKILLDQEAGSISNHYDKAKLKTKVEINYETNSLR